MSTHLIDWNVAVATATRLVRPGPQVSQAAAHQVVDELKGLSKRAQHHVREFTGLDGALDSSPARIVDRPGWIKANVEGFRVVLEPLMEQLAERRGTGVFAGGAGGQLIQSVGSRVTGVQVGAILAYMAGRVLGQYELFLPPDPSGRTPAGRLTLVAPNIVNVEQELNVDTRDFRLWVCLHEETHRAQFAGVDWLRAYVQEQVTAFLLASDLDPGAILDRLRGVGEAVADAVRGGGDTSLIEAIQTPAQREILDRLTAVMTLVEGHGDYVMDAVGPEVVPSVEEIRRRFQQRREGGSRLDQTIRRLLGVDLKMKQYAEGAKFVRAVVEAGGMDGFNRVWTSPETLPTIGEIKDPAAWIERVLRDGRTGVAPPAPTPLPPPPEPAPQQPEQPQSPPRSSGPPPDSTPAHEGGASGVPPAAAPAPPGDASADAPERNGGHAAPEDGGQAPSSSYDGPYGGQSGHPGQPPAGNGDGAAPVDGGGPAAPAGDVGQVRPGEARGHGSPEANGRPAAPGDALGGPAAAGGPAGAAGPAQSPGTGATGPAEPPGTAGPTGPAGLSDPSGPSGPEGPIDPAGFAGPTGPPRPAEPGGSTGTARPAGDAPGSAAAEPPGTASGPSNQPEPPPQFGGAGEN